MVSEGSFRQDLLYRINTIEIKIPPLRERGNDIILLSEYFLKHYNRKYRKNISGITREAESKLLKYNWPGNVRELQNVIERAVILAGGNMLRPVDFPLYPSSAEKRKSTDEILNLEQVEKNAIERAMRLSSGNISYAAELLGITRFSLYRKIEKYKL